MFGVSKTSALIWEGVDLWLLLGKSTHHTERHFTVTHIQRLDCALRQSLTFKSTINLDSSQAKACIQALIDYDREGHN